MTAIVDYRNKHADSRIEIACVNYLTSLGYTLWSSWEIVREDRRKKAANWFATEMTEVLDQMNTVDLAKVLTASRLRRVKAWWYGAMTKWRMR